jgi:hypothetical protein
VSCVVATQTTKKEGMKEEEPQRSTSFTKLGHCATLKLLLFCTFCSSDGLTLIDDMISTEDKLLMLP